MYTVDYFIDKFEKIPEDKWIMGELYTENGYCAFGHCGSRGLTHTDESNGLIKLFSENLYRCHVIPINDGKDELYQQPTPKQRILAALYDIKKQQQPIYENISKELAVLPISETSDQPIKQLT